jgi:hypothetical protein
MRVAEHGMDLAVSERAHVEQAPERLMRLLLGSSM